MLLSRLIHQIQAENGVRLHLEHLQNQNKTALETGGVCDKNDSLRTAAGKKFASERFLL